eukprot:TRINITY_DN13347_c0_g1_i1.p1 TRINITY_DN13347_c0_g1~~TRINITY_DN13347_c0_g1_i1.p1  ORF type:complete len:959 (+),score=226.24 TRINITY_DN13347_c0_g1_i1:88-2964(+)
MPVPRREASRTPCRPPPRRVRSPTPHTPVPAAGQRSRSASASAPVVQRRCRSACTTQPRRAQRDASMEGPRRLAAESSPRLPAPERRVLLMRSRFAGFEMRRAGLASRIALPGNGPRWLVFRVIGNPRGGHCVGALLPKTAQCRDQETRPLPRIPGVITSHSHLREGGSHCLAKVDPVRRTVQWYHGAREGPLAVGPPVRVADADWPLCPALQCFGPEVSAEVCDVTDREARREGEQMLQRAKALIQPSPATPSSGSLQAMTPLGGHSECPKPVPPAPLPAASGEAPPPETSRTAVTSYASASAGSSPERAHETAAVDPPRGPSPEAKVEVLDGICAAVAAAEGRALSGDTQRSDPATPRQPKTEAVQEVPPADTAQLCGTSEAGTRSSAPAGARRRPTLTTDNTLSVSDTSPSRSPQRDAPAAGRGGAPPARSLSPSRAEIQELVSALRAAEGRAREERLRAQQLHGEVDALQAAAAAHRSEQRQLRAQIEDMRFATQKGAREAAVRVGAAEKHAEGLTRALAEARERGCAAARRAEELARKLEQAELARDQAAALAAADAAAAAERLRRAEDNLEYERRAREASERAALDAGGCLGRMADAAAEFATATARADHAESQCAELRERLREVGEQCAREAARRRDALRDLGLRDTQLREAVDMVELLKQEVQHERERRLHEVAQAREELRQHLGPHSARSARSALPRPDPAPRREGSPGARASAAVRSSTSGGGEGRRLEWDTSSSPSSDAGSSLLRGAGVQGGVSDDQAESTASPQQLHHLSRLRASQCPLPEDSQATTPVPSSPDPRPSAFSKAHTSSGGATDELAWVYGRNSVETYLDAVKRQLAETQRALAERDAELARLRTAAASPLLRSSSGRLTRSMDEAADSICQELEEWRERAVTAERRLCAAVGSQDAPADYVARLVSRAEAAEEQRREAERERDELRQMIECSAGSSW